MISEAKGVHYLQVIKYKQSCTQTGQIKKMITSQFKKDKQVLFFGLVLMLGHYPEIQLDYWQGYVIQEEGQIEKGPPMSSLPKSDALFVALRLLYSSINSFFDLFGSRCLILNDLFLEKTNAILPGEQLCSIDSRVYLLALALNSEKLEAVTRNQVADKLHRILARPIKNILEQFLNIEGWNDTKELIRQAEAGRQVIVAEKDDYPELREIVDSCLSAEEESLQSMLKKDNQYHEDNAVKREELQKDNDEIMRLERCMKEDVIIDQ